MKLQAALSAVPVIVVLVVAAALAVLTPLAVPPGNK